MMLDLDQIGSTTVVRMNHAAENRFNRPLVEALHQLLDRLEADPPTRALVFTGGHEKYFSNGLDLAWIITQPRDALPAFLVRWNNLLHRVFTYPKPIVAAVNGHAFAGGLFFALACDHRVMRQDRGYLCIPEIDLNLDLPPGNVALIAHVIGSRNADRYSLSAERLSPAEALRIGMVDELAAQDQVLPRALETAHRLGAKDPYQFHRHKLGLRREPARILAEEDPPFIEGLFSSRL